MGKFVCKTCGKEFTKQGNWRQYTFCSRTCSDRYASRNVPTKEWFYDKYWVENLTMVDIAQILNKDPKTVLYWMRKYKIPTRPRGSNMPEALRYWETGKQSPRIGTHHTEEAKKVIRESTLKDGRIPYLKNGKHWLKQDGVHPPNWKGGITPLRQTFNRSSEWKEAVKAVWKKADAKCQLCGLDSRTVDRKKTRFALHHLLSFAEHEELRGNPDNLVLLCEKCHNFIHSKRNTEKIFLP